MIINIQELRIGNYVRAGDTPHARRVESLFSSLRRARLRSDRGDSSTFSEDEMIPIEITEEWLLKLGFRLMDSDGYEYTQYKNKDWRFYVFKADNYDGYLLVDGMVTITDRVKHVHQLQNLYFALSGEELTLKED